MIPPPLPFAVLALSLLVTLYLAYRSRAVPALRPAAVACAVFVALDVARWCWGPAVERGEVAWWRLDAVVMALLPACWAALLPPQRWWTAPPLLIGTWTWLLFEARHLPDVHAHWLALLQAPRLVVGAAALLVVVRGRAGKDEGPGVAVHRRANPSPRLRHLRCRLTAGEPTSPSVLAQPSRTIGASMALAAGLMAVWGLWSDWGQIQLASALAWVVAAVIAWRA